MKNLANIKTIGVEANSLDYLAPHIKHGEDQSLTNACQKLSVQLQRTLDLHYLMNHFCQQASSIVPCDTLSYFNEALDLTIEQGTKSQHICHYLLELDGEKLGAIECTSESVFSEKELSRLETLLSLLIFPLRNALLYYNAIQQAHRDPLTNLGNRSAYNLALETEIYRANRHDNHLSMLIVDIDHFKKVNDTHGHLTGDQVLKSVSYRIQQIVRKSDLVYRYGGEEFVILMTNTQRLAAQEIAQRIRALIAQEAFKVMENKISVTVSIGVSELQKGEKGNTFFHRADQALYSAKHNGRNQVVAA